MMTKDKPEELQCENCGQPLFLSKEECRNFIEKKMEDGHFVCRCCGAKQNPRKS